LNFYSHHIGDRLTATVHLSWLEDCALSRLTDLYLKQERAIVADVVKVARLVRATAAEEVAAVETVLKEFFVLADHGWVSDDCEAKIASAKEAQQRARDNGKKGGRPPLQKPGVSPAASQQVPSGNPEETQPVSGGNPEKSDSQAPITQYPSTNTQYPVPTTPNNGNLSSSDLRSDGGDGAPKAKPKKHFGTDEDHKFVRWMFERIRAVDATAKEPSWDAWANDMRLMREQDGRTHHDACALFDWANKDPFWRANVMSPAKLREKWSQLSLKRQNPASTGASTRAPAMTDEQRAAKNAEETAKAKALYRERYGDGGNAGGDVIDAEAKVVPEWAAIEGSIA
jgi:uncharacterized protein YdaU (DUF1376 family)